MKKENYSTHIPNVLFDTHLPDLKQGELKVLLAILRLTIGFKLGKDPNIRKQRDWISVRRFEQITGLSRRSISSAIESLLFRQLIDATNKDGIPLNTAYKRRGRQRIFFSCRLSKEKNLLKTNENNSVSLVQKMPSTKSYTTNIKTLNTEQKSNKWKTIGQLLRQSNFQLKKY